MDFSQDMMQAMGGGQMPMQGVDPMAMDPSAGMGGMPNQESAPQDDIEAKRQLLMEHAEELGMTPEEIQQLPPDQVEALYEQLQAQLGEMGSGADQMSATDPAMQGMDPSMGGVDPSMGGMDPAMMGGMDGEMPPEAMGDQIPEAKWGTVVGRPKYFYGGPIDPRSTAYQSQVALPCMCLSA